MISLRQLGDCEARELIKAKVENATEWAIVGLRRPDYSPLIFLTGDNAPLVYNTAPDPGDFATYPVAKYETKYRFLPDPNGACQIGNSELSRAAGSLVLTQDGDWYLVANQYRQRGVRWFHLKTGEVLGEAGSHRIAFGEWDLLIEAEELKHKPSESALLNHPSRSRRMS